MRFVSCEIVSCEICELLDSEFVMVSRDLWDSELVNPGF